MSTDSVAPLSNEPNQPLADPAVSNPPPPPSSSPRDERVTEHVAQLKVVLSYIKRYLFSIAEDVVKPSIKSFLETCDTNPRTAAIIATPAILAFMVALTFLILATLLLVLWTVLSVLVGVAFVVVGAVLSLIFKLFIVVAATVPLAGIAGGLFVGANSAAQYIMNKLPQREGSSTASEQPSAENTGDFAEKCLVAFEKLWDGLVRGTATLVVLLFKFAQTVIERAAPSIPTEGPTTSGVTSHGQVEDDGEEPITRAWNRLIASFVEHVAPPIPTNRPPQQREHEAGHPTEPNEEFSFHITSEAGPEEPPEQRDTVVVVEPVTIPDADPQESHKGLTRRVGFSTPQEEVEEPTM